MGPWAKDGLACNMCFVLSLGSGPLFVKIYFVLVMVTLNGIFGSLHLSSTTIFLF